MSLFPTTSMGWWVAGLLVFYLVLREVLHRRFRRQAQQRKDGRR